VIASVWVDVVRILRQGESLWALAAKPA